MTRQRTNRKAFAEISDMIEREWENFNQGRWTHNCNAPACIAGYAVVLMPGFVRFSHVDNDGYALFDDGSCDFIPYAAQDFLGLTYRQRKFLFHGDPEFSWPPKYAEMWKAGRNDKKQQAMVAAKLCRDISRRGARAVLGY